MDSVVSSNAMDPLGSDYLADPHKRFESLRANRPVYFDEELGLWVVSRSADVEAALINVKSFSSSQTILPIFPVCEHAGKLFGAIEVDPVTVMADPPVHTRTRRAIARCFPTNRRGALVYEAKVRDRVEKLVLEMASLKQIDMIAHFSWVLPIWVIMDLLGVPDDDFGRIKKWSDGQIAIIAGRTEEAEQLRLVGGMAEFFDYCKELVAKKRNYPGDDLPSALLHYRNGDDAVLTEREIASIAFNFLVAGHETTANLLGNGLHVLLSTDGAWRRLVENPETIPAAVEEILRYNPPIISWMRVTAQDVRLGDRTIPEGQRVLLLIGSANRDSGRFPDEPEQFIVDRTDAARHISFGIGAHFCVGNAVARLEARIALEELIRHMPDLRLTQGYKPSWLQNVLFRGLKELQVEWGSR